ncbi:MAG: hypothetical protein ACE1Y4_01435, partial [Lysobacterales bacterium]
AISLPELRRGYSGLLGNPVFVGYAILTGTSLGAVFAFLTAGPFIFINNFGVATQDFGLYYLFIVASYILGSFLIHRVAHVVDPTRSLWFGVTMALVGAGLVMWLVQTGLESPLTITIGMCLMFFGAGPVFAIAPSKALDATVNRVGYAAALLGCAELAVGGVAAAVITVLHDETSMPLAITLMGLAGSAVVVLWFVGRCERKSI